MNKKSLWLILILSLIVTLPAFQGQASISPEDAANYTSTGVEEGNDGLSTNDFSETYDGNTIDIIEVDAENTIILLNSTYELQIHHNDTSVGVKATRLDPTPFISSKADEFLFDVEFNIDASGKSLDIQLPTSRILLTQEPYADDVWNAQINEEILLTLNSTEKSFSLDYLTSSIILEGDDIYFTDTLNPANNFVLTRASYDDFFLMTPDGLFNILFNSTHVFVDWVGNLIVQPMGPHIPFQWTGVAPMVSISFVDNCVMVEWEDVTVQILDEMVIMIIDFIVITWYFLLLIEMITIVIFDFTFIFYLAIVELIAVIIYETFEIKIYETQVVIVYQFIEIIFLFISVLMWELTFIFHFEFWFIQIIFLVHLVFFLIINQVRIVFVPIIVPIFIPLIYYIPVIMKQYVHIYVPYAAEQLFIDVDYQDLQYPSHTIRYNVTDQLGRPVPDATVAIGYNGTNYPASHIGNGIYQVQLPASDEQERITVTATKAWYPSATISYDLNVTWQIGIQNVTTTITQPSPLPIISVLLSAVAVGLGMMVINRRKKKQ
jgi:hypothetical protein